MFTTSLRISSVIILSLLHICVHSSSDLDFKVLQTFGRAQQPFITSIRIPVGETPLDARLAEIDRRIATGVYIQEVVQHSVGGRYYNISGYIEADGNLGYTTYVLIVKFENGKKIGFDGSLDVIGVRFDGKQGTIYTGRNIKPASLEDCTILPRSAYVSIVGESLEIINPQNRADLPHTISIICPQVRLDGEIAEFEIET